VIPAIKAKIRSFCCRHGRHKWVASRWLMGNEKRYVLVRTIRVCSWCGRHEVIGNQSYTNAKERFAELYETPTRMERMPDPNGG